MNKYEMTVVLSAKLEEEERAAVLTNIKHQQLHHPFRWYCCKRRRSWKEEAGLRNPEDEGSLLLLHYT